MHWRHKWEVIAARQRSQPVADDLTRVPGRFVVDVVTPKTDVLWRCACGAVRSDDLHGYWTLEQLQGVKP